MTNRPPPSSSHVATFRPQTQTLLLCGVSIPPQSQFLAYLVSCSHSHALPIPHSLTSFVVSCQPASPPPSPQQPAQTPPTTAMHLIAHPCLPHSQQLSQPRQSHAALDARPHTKYGQAKFDDANVEWAHPTHQLRAALFARECNPSPLTFGIMRKSVVETKPKPDASSSQSRSPGLLGQDQNTQPHVC